MESCISKDMSQKYFDDLLETAFSKQVKATWYVAEDNLESVLNALEQAPDPSSVLTVGFLDSVEVT